ncbi:MULTISPECIES: DUF1481 domain-containing protein [unclassified Vibrio]|uniref:DUF1481 domain-containing protein n=1 Tax=unclassified Vibrio TaxID=2614977 RepID=UPI0013618B49|nr:MULTISPECIES: DUF1481 domain-containing protein [unclassified Vibrio]NAW59722.1 DUF1481 domain-containing protein [Vibrio sp. V36_P2S2PM302]NAX25410.1 DUF1481 domain-containing protein [Vibrio sp. V38_P2S17PM301]NAX32433.1 DUF1481 domain-containing protein [Vibrio sp. V37_P2S8PM304]
MKNWFLSSLILLPLIGCSSSAPTPNLEQFSEYTGGQSLGDATSFYWYTEQQSQPLKAADYVSAGDYGWYQSEYRWDEGQVREMIREGKQRKSEALVDYRIHIRFNKDGEAVFQRYRLDGKVLPLNEQQLASYVREADNVASTAKKQDKAGFELLQGVWDGATFESCTGQEYRRLSFNQTLPSFVVNRLAAIDSYVAFIGKIKSDGMIVEQLLMLADEDHGCIQRPGLLEKQ